MLAVGIKNLKNHLSSYLQKVKEGEILTVTDRGKNVAYILPIDSKNVMDEVLPLIKEGLLNWNGGKPKGNIRPPVIRGKQTSDIVLEDRR